MERKGMAREGVKERKAKYQLWKSTEQSFTTVRRRVATCIISSRKASRVSLPVAGLVACWLAELKVVLSKKVKLVFPQRRRIFRPIRLPIDSVHRNHGWIWPNRPFCGRPAVPQKAEFTVPEQMMQPREVFRSSDLIKSCRALKRRWLHLLLRRFHPLPTTSPLLGRYTLRKEVSFTSRDDTFLSCKMA